MIARTSKTLTRADLRDVVAPLGSLLARQARGVGLQVRDNRRANRLIAPPQEASVSTDSFAARSELKVGKRRFEIFRLDALQQRFDVARLPFSLKILL
jgi:hypothetical protein